MASRWIRLLFGREFAFEQLLSLWDRIFAYDPTLELIDLICVAMLLRIRWTCKMHRSSMSAWMRLTTRQYSKPTIQLPCNSC
jgi:hypothetical protein